MTDAQIARLTPEQIAQIPESIQRLIADILSSRGGSKNISKVQVPENFSFTPAATQGFLSDYFGETYNPPKRKERSFEHLVNYLAGLTPGPSNMKGADLPGIGDVKTSRYEFSNKLDVTKGHGSSFLKKIKDFSGESLKLLRLKTTGIL